jgi:hypothetical protein
MCNNTFFVLFSGCLQPVQSKKHHDAKKAYSRMYVRTL